MREMLDLIGFEFIRPFIIVTMHPIQPDHRGGEQDVPMDPRALRGLDPQSAGDGWTCTQPLLPN